LPFQRRPFLIGVVHLLPTPGSPRWGGDLEALLARARRDAGALAQGGCDGILVENFGDAPFHPGCVPPQTVAALVRALDEVRREVPDLPLGVNVLRNDARAALAVSTATGAEYLRVNVHVGAMLTDQGLIEGRAHETLRERTRLGLETAILADVLVKHAQPLAPLEIGDAARETLERGLADGVIVTGRATGSAPLPAEVAEVRAAVGDAPLLVGSGVTEENAHLLTREVDGVIVGTALKRGGRVEGEVDADRVRALRAALDG